jgi:hypothetical protein
MEPGLRREPMPFVPQAIRIADSSLKRLAISQTANR